ncbi:MAG: ROK family protein [Clostridia bacterium]|nr:ROK family protein [Clostridia bacterium]
MGETGNSNLLRTMNTSAVLAALKRERRATKHRLAELTGLSTVTVGTALEQLTRTGEALPDEVVPSNGGRPAQSFRFHAAYRYGLALYIREQTLSIRVADLYGVCVHREDEPLGDADRERFCPVIDRMLRRYPEIGSIGFGLPGVVRDGYVILSDHPGLTGVRLVEEYSARYGLPVSAENDVNLAVLGYCKEEGTDSVAYLYFPDHEAPGAGIVLGGTLCRGAHSLVGEIRCLPPAIDWHALDWGNFDSVCDAVSNVTRSFACILDPERILLYGVSLTEGHREAVQWNCAQSMDIGFLPQLRLAENFDSDYERGAVLLALNAIAGER